MFDLCSTLNLNTRHLSAPLHVIGPSSPRGKRRNILTTRLPY
jgi:hypothetical protein